LSAVRLLQFFWGVMHVIRSVNYFYSLMERLVRQLFAFTLNPVHNQYTKYFQILSSNQ